MSDHTTVPLAVCDGTVVPAPLKPEDIWVLWDRQNKTPIAPWETGDCYRAGWGEGVVEDTDSRMTDRPETTYKRAKMLADLNPRILHDSYPFPRNDDGQPDIPDRLTPTILLPHAPTGDVLLLVDFDDVRDPETGVITSEVQDILDRLGGYTEISVSGTGLHVYVHAQLPPGLGKFHCSLHDDGDIEMYDHGRFCASTWDHVEGTPVEIPDRQAVIDDLIETYEDEAHRDRRLQGTKRIEEGRSDDEIDRIRAKIRGDSHTPSSSNPYYELDVGQIANTGAFRTHGDGSSGPHPSHGGTQSKDRDSTNFSLDESDNHWYCFAHDSGGGPLHLIAVLEGIRDCANTTTLEGDELLETCLYARDYYGTRLDDEDPPYEALVAVAKEFDLAMSNPEKDILGQDSHRLAGIIFDELSPTDI